MDPAQFLSRSAELGSDLKLPIAGVTTGDDPNFRKDLLRAHRNLHDVKRPRGDRMVQRKRDAMAGEADGGHFFPLFKGIRCRRRANPCVQHLGRPLAAAAIHVALEAGNTLTRRQRLSVHIKFIG
jgi:hypothetical protein